MNSKVFQVLVVDNKKANLDKIERMIKKSFKNSIVYTETSYEHCYKTVKKETIDIIVLDFAFFLESKFELCSKLKTDPVLKYTPVVFLIEFDLDVELRQKAIDSGADAFIFKPIKEERISRLINTILKIKESNKQDDTESSQLKVLMDEQKKELEETQRLLVDVIQANHIGVWEWNIIENKVQANDSFAKMLGYNNEEYPKTKEGRLKLIHDEDREMVVNNLDRTANKLQESYSIEYRIKHKNGNWIWIYDTGKVISLTEEGKSLLMAGYYHDITAKKEAEERLKEREEQFRILFDKAPFGYQSLDFNGCFIEVNHKWLAMLGYKKEEVIGKWFGDFIDEKYKENFKNRFEKFKSQGELYSEFPMISKDGEKKLMAFDGKIGYTDKNEFKQTHCTIKDITELTLANEKLKKSELNYNLLMDFLPMGMVLHKIVLDDQGKPIDYLFQDCNKQFEEQIGMKIDEVVGKSVLEVFPHTEKSWIKRYGEVALTGKTAIFENYAVDLDKYFKVTAFQTEYKSFAVIADDITAEKKKQNEIVYLSNHDFLSGLFNRRYFVKEFARLDEENQYPLCLMMIDINGLKIINDAFGHNVGDIAIKEFSRVCLKSFRTQDVIARIGGDEFAILLPRTTPEQVEALNDIFKANIKKIYIENIQMSVATGYQHKISDTMEGIDELLKNSENHMYRHKLSEGISNRNNAIKAILKTLTDKYVEERAHSNNVSSLCKQYGIVSNMKEDDIKELELAGLFHDIGKISLPDAILYKKGRLTDDEYKTIKTHPEVGYQILRAADEYSDLAVHALYHHERWDGFGYPKGLKGEEIPYFSRIICVVDSYEAMTAVRPYKNKMSKNEAVEEIIRCAGTQFDVEIAKVFVEKVLKAEWKYSTHQ